MYQDAQLKEYSFPLKIPVESLVNMLRYHLGMRVNFEGERMTYEAGGIKARDAVAMYGDRPSASLCAHEKFVLGVAREQMAKNEGDTVIDYKRRYLELTPSDLKDLSALRKKIEATGVFLTDVSDGAITIYPKNSDYEKITFHGEFQSAAEAVLSLIKVLHERNMSLAGSNLVADKTHGPIRLNVENEDFRTFLTKFAHAIAPEAFWSISGYDNAGRTVGFRKSNQHGN